MKILHLLNSRNFAGTEQLVLTLCTALAGAGHEVHVAVKSGGVLAQKYREARLDVIDVSLNSFFVKWWLSRWVREHKPDVIHAHLTGAARLGVRLAEKTGVPLVTHLHILREARAYREAAEAGELVAISERVLRFYRDECAGIPAGKIHLVQNATLAFEAPANEVPRAGAAAQIKAALGLAPASRLLLIAARISPEKGHEWLLRALPAVAARHPNVVVLAAGNTAQKPEFVKKVRELARVLGVEQHFRLLGFRDDVPLLLRAAEAQLVLSEDEPFGLGVIEAFAAGTPVIGSNSGALPDLLRGELGTLVPYGDVTALAVALNAHLDESDDAPARAARTAAARADALARYSPAALRDGVLAVYQKALARL
jgi:glycosyltransferase involved in cell wall biosynthesis